jgi:hypothetical protein
MISELESMWKEQSCPISMYYVSIYLREMRKTTKVCVLAEIRKGRYLNISFIPWNSFPDNCFVKFSSVWLNQHVLSVLELLHVHRRSENVCSCFVHSEHLFKLLGHAIAQAVSRRLPTVSARVWTQAAAVGRQRLTAWAMARPGC